VKRILSFVLALTIYSLPILSIALTPDSPGYDAYKRSLVNDTTQTINTTGYPLAVTGGANTAKDEPAMLIPLDGTFTLAMSPNDDGSSANIPLPWTFSLYGTNYNSFYINNNGNISFTDPYSAYSASGFPLSGYPMLAAFWGDVDTRPTGGGNVYYKITSSPNRVVVIWDHVGYYGNYIDKLNTFEAIFTDGTDPFIGIGNNVVYSYGDMAWTTGSASGGTGGFGGTPATVGINKGDGTTYIQSGRFNQAGSYYDGDDLEPYDGIDWLDDRDLYMQASDSYVLIVLPDNVDNVTAGHGYPPDVLPGDTTVSPYIATYTGTGYQDVQIAVDAGIWRGWIYYSGAWHQADVFPYTGPGFVVFSDVPFGLKADIPILLDLEEPTLPVELSSFTAIATALDYVELQWITQSETGVSGYYIYRCDTDNLAYAQLVSPLVTAANTSNEHIYHYTDEEVTFGTWYYWLQNVDMNGAIDFHGPISVNVSQNGDGGEPVIPAVTSLKSIYPNPFNPNTTVSFGLVNAENVKIVVYNIKGEKVKTIVNRHMDEGTYRLPWNGTDDNGRSLASGIYTIKMTAGKYISTQNAVLMK